MNDYEDICGNKYNMLLVIRQAEDYVNKNGRHFRKWLCRCDCGNEKAIPERALKCGITKSCGCLRQRENMCGKRFGRLVVLEKLQERNKHRSVLWLCKCDCGNTIKAPTSSLTTGNTTSCGCLRKENSINACTKHGFTSNGKLEKLYLVWRHMKHRCTSPNDKSYKNYGGRGITVCDEWYNSYLAFREWAYENGYSENYNRLECTIDRIDNNKGYCPENCRWTDSVTQANNKSNNYYITFNNETHTASEWGKIVGIKGYNITRRIKAGWSIEEALMTPLQIHIKHDEDDD